MSDQSVAKERRVVPVGEGPLGFIVHFNFKPGWEEERTRQGYVDFIETMRQEPTFVSFFRLEDQANPNRVREKFGFFVNFDIKPGREQEFRGVLDPLLDTMSAEARFVNYFLLQHETVPNRFTIYETWLGTVEEFLAAEMPRPYRQEYEVAVESVLARPREVERNWKLRYAADRGTAFRGYRM